MSRSSRIQLWGSPLAAARRWLIGAKDLTHNGTRLRDYPEEHWDFVPFPAQKGEPYVADNLGTVNDHSFLVESRFIAAHKAASSRWALGTRDIRWRLHVFLWAVETALRTHPDAALVELGTGNGYMAAGACDYFDWGQTALTAGRSLWLIDSFEAKRRDETAEVGPRRFFYADGDDDVRTYFAKYRGVTVVRGWLPEVIDVTPIEEQVCFVHVDLNSAEAEVGSLERLGPRLVGGSIVLLDDSGNPGCADQLLAHREWALSRSASFLHLPSGQGLAVLPRV
jgi:O-methyltransferase